MNEITIPALTHALKIDLGEGFDGTPQSVTFGWTREALTRENYPAFAAMENEEYGRLQRIINEKMLEDQANLEEARKKTKSKNPEVLHYRKLISALDKCEREFEALETDAITETESVDLTVQKVGLINQLIASVQPDNTIKTMDEVNAQIAKDEEEAALEYARRRDVNARKLMHLCPVFRINDGPAVKSTLDSLCQHFDADFMAEVVALVIQEHRRPLSKAGNTGT